MTELRNPKCLFRMLWYSLKLRAWVSGHRFEIDHEDERVTVLKCMDCGHCSVGWVR